MRSQEVTRKSQEIPRHPQEIPENNKEILRDPRTSPRDPRKSKGAFVGGREGGMKIFFCMRKAPKPLATLILVQDSRRVKVQP